MLLGSADILSWLVRRSDFSWLTRTTADVGGRAGTGRSVASLRVRCSAPPPSAALALLAIAACDADDRVLTPDERNDASVVTDDAGDAGASDAAAVDGADSSGGGSDAGVDASNMIDAGGGAAADPSCDLNGIWIGRQNTESEALFFPQFANNWYYIELAQSGDQVVVSKHFDCGIKVLGTVNVELSPGTMRALMQHNFQAGRKGTVTKQADGTCALQIDRFWSVRGVSEAAYVPSPRNRDVSIAQLNTENPLPSDTAKSEDWDQDGRHGTAWNVVGIASGQRHSAQRDWTRWFTAPDYTIPAGNDFTADLLLRAEFSNEEKVYEADNETLRATSTPKAGAPHTVTLRFLGRTKQDARAAALVKPDDFETCLAIQAALPAIKGLK